MLSESLAAATFRASRQYEVVPFDRLSVAEQRTARTPTGAAARVYGVIRATRPDGGSARSVCADVALLFLSLREPGRLPAYFADAPGPVCDETLAGLVADGILEIDVGGTYTSGPRGLAAMVGSAALPRHPWQTDALSAAALRYALASASSDVREIAAQLYAYHRIPASARWRAQLGSPGDVERFLGIGSIPEIEFQAVGGWYCWQSPAGAATCRYKLYVSPQPGALRETVAAVAGAARYGAHAMKIGGDLQGLLRPDKLVVHFGAFEDLARVAQRLDRELAEIPVHGVPFAAAIGTRGLLSWGVDAFANASMTSAPLSWRQWVTLRVAEALAVVKRQTAIDDDEVWAFIHRRLGLEGVDARTWEPQGALRRGDARATI